MISKTSGNNRAQILIELVFFAGLVFGMIGILQWIVELSDRRTESYDIYWDFRKSLPERVTN